MIMASEYFEAQATDVMATAGGDPANAGQLAAWAEDARLHRDWQRLGVIVAYDGTLVAETIRLNVLVGITATYVVDLLVELPDPEDVDGVLLDLAVASIRRQLVGLLSGLGMSTRAIAPVVGTSQWTVRQDRDSGEREPLTSPTPAERIDPATGEVIELTEAEARRLTERIRSALDRVSTAWADLAERITEAYQRRADLALGYGSWSEYAEAELKPSEGLAADVRRQLVGMLSAAGMSTRAIAPTVGAGVMTVSDDRKALRAAGVRTPYTSEPESLDEYRGRVLADAEPNQRIVKLTGPESVGDPTPARVVGLDGKTYARPEPKETTKETPMTTAPSRLAIPQPPRYGGNRPRHAQIVPSAIATIRGAAVALDFDALDGSLDGEEAARLADDLSNIIRSLKRTQSLLKKES